MNNTDIYNKTSNPVIIYYRVIIVLFLCLFFVVITASKCNGETINKNDRLKADKIFRQGLTHLENKDYREAVKDFQKVIIISPNNYKAHINLAIAYKKLGRIKESRKEYSTSARILEQNKANKLKNQTNPIDPDQDYLDMGGMYYKTNQFETAIEYFNYALKINPDNDITYYNISKCYFELYNYEKAEENILQALKLSPDDIGYISFENEIKKYLKEIKSTNTQIGRIVENEVEEQEKTTVKTEEKPLMVEQYTEPAADLKNKVKAQNIMIDLSLNDKLNYDYEAYINSDGSISLPFKTTAKILDIQTEQNHLNNVITFNSPSGIQGNVDYKNQEITFGTKVIKFNPDTPEKLVFLKTGLNDYIKDEVFVPVKCFGEITESSVNSDLINYSVSVKTDKPLSAIVKFYTKDENEADPFGSDERPDDTYTKILFPEKFPLFSLNTISLDSNSQFCSDKMKNRDSTYKYLFKNNISQVGLDGSLIGGSYKLELNSQIFGQDFFSFGGLSARYKRLFGKSNIELGNLTGFKSPRINVGENTLGASIGNFKDKPDAYNNIYGIANLGSKINVYFNDKLATTVNTRGGYYNLNDIANPDQKVTKVKIEEVTLEGKTSIIKEEKYPYSDELLLKGKTNYSILGGIAGYENSLFNNYYCANDMNSKKLTGGIKLSRGLTDKITLNLVGTADHILSFPKITNISSLFPYNNNATSLLFSSYKDFNYVSGQTLISSLDYAITKNLTFATDFGLSNSKTQDYLSGEETNSNITDDIRNYKFKSAGTASNVSLNYQSDLLGFSTSIFKYSPSFYIAGSSGIGSSATALNDKTGGEIGGRLSTRLISLAGTIDKYSTNLDNYFMNGNFDFNDYDYTVRVPLPGNSDINYRQTLKHGKNTMGELSNKSYEINLRKKISGKIDFDLDGQLLKFGTSYDNDMYESDMKYITARLRYDISETKGIIDLSHDIFKSRINEYELGYNALRIGYTFPEFRNIFSSFSTGVHYTGLDKGFDFAASIGYKFPSGRRFTLTYNYNRQLGSFIDDIFIPKTSRHSIDFNLTDAFLVNNGIKSIGYTSEDSGYIQTIAYLDTNQNGKRDASEPCIPEIGVHLANNKEVTYYTNKKGTYTSGGIPEGLYKVCLDYDELPSLLAVSPASNEEYLVRVDRNKLSKVYFGLLSMIGSVSGKINVTDEFNRKVDIKDLVLILYNEKGEEVKYTTAENDGYYYIGEISPGKYTLALDKNFMKEYHLKPKNSEGKEISFPLTYKDCVDLKNVNLDFMQIFENSL